MAILQVISTALTKLRGPWLIGGDWNVSPEELERSGWLQSVGGFIVATTENTCNSSRYDFFVVSTRMRHAVRGIQLVDDHGFKPHFPARLLIAGDARRKLVRHIKKPTKVEGVLPHGPSCTKAQFPIDSAISHDLPKAVTEWYSGAREELRSLAAFNGKKVNELGLAHFAWEPAVGPCADPQAGATWSSATWRTFARYAYDSSRKTSDDNVAHQKMVDRYVQQAILKADQSRDTDVTQLEMWKWVHKFAKANATKNGKIFTSLATLAEKHATKSEDDARKTDNAAWKNWATNGTVSKTGSMLPSRAAYQWIKSPAGWAKIRQGKATDEDGVPEEIVFDDVPEGTAEAAEAADVNSEQVFGLHGLQASLFRCAPKQMWRQRPRPGLAYGRRRNSMT